MSEKKKHVPTIRIDEKALVDGAKAAGVPLADAQRIQAHLEQLPDRGKVNAALCCILRQNGKEAELVKKALGKTLDARGNLIDAKQAS
jgi:hypothetical protein